MYIKLILNLGRSEAGLLQHAPSDVTRPTPVPSQGAHAVSHTACKYIQVALINKLQWLPGQTTNVTLRSPSFVIGACQMRAKQDFQVLNRLPRPSSARGQICYTSDMRQTSGLFSLQPETSWVVNMRIFLERLTLTLVNLFRRPTCPVRPESSSPPHRPQSPLTPHKTPQYHPSL